MEFFKNQWKFLSTDAIWKNLDGLVLLIQNTIQEGGRGEDHKSFEIYLMHPKIIQNFSLKEGVHKISKLITFFRLSQQIIEVCMILN